MIIDIHTHLGDILYPDGGKLIDRKNIQKKFSLILSLFPNFYCTTGFPIRLISGRIKRFILWLPERHEQEMPQPHWKICGHPWMRPELIKVCVCPSRRM